MFQLFIVCSRLSDSTFKLAIHSKKQTMLIVIYRVSIVDETPILTIWFLLLHSNMSIVHKAMCPRTKPGLLLFCERNHREAAATFDSLNIAYNWRFTEQSGFILFYYNFFFTNSEALALNIKWNDSTSCELINLKDYLSKLIIWVSQLSRHIFSFSLPIKCVLTIGILVLRW